MSFIDAYIVNPAYEFNSQVAFISLKERTPDCVNDEVVVKDLSGLSDADDLEEHDGILLGWYEEQAWKDAKKLAEAPKGELLTVHWVDTEMISLQVSAALILLDNLPAYDGNDS